ncbi:MAG: GPP34 family phosphoprotein [Mycobacteriales bacterium]
MWKRVVDGLVEQGALDRDPRGLWRVTAHPVLRPELRDEVVARLRAAAAGDGEIEPRTAVVLALAGPARLLEVVADKPHDHAKRRIAAATAGAVAASSS